MRTTKKMQMQGLRGEEYRSILGVCKDFRAEYNTADALFCSSHKFGLIGHPINHSLSPALFRAGYNGKYPYDLIETEDFEEAYSRFLNGYDGINVTAPFKEQAFSRADILSPECIMTGAANLLIKTSEGVKAYNSDYYGVMLAVLQAVGNDMAALPPRPSADECAELIQDRVRSALVIGLGGAGKAAAAAAHTLGLCTTLMNRTAEKAEEFAKKHHECGFKVRHIDEFAEAFAENDVILYTIPYRIPAADRVTDTGRTKYLLEANYRDPALQDLPAAYISGRQWLLGQAYAGYDIFTGEVPDIRAMSQVLH